MLCDVIVCMLYNLGSFQFVSFLPCNTVLPFDCCPQSFKIPIVASLFSFLPEVHDGFRHEHIFIKEIWDKENSFLPKREELLPKTDHF